ncbi:20007_t:CDS:1, partial [Racocetra persica]
YYITPYNLASKQAPTTPLPLDQQAVSILGLNTKTNKTYTSVIKQYEALANANRWTNTQGSL